MDVQRIADEVWAKVETGFSGVAADQIAEILAAAWNEGYESGSTAAFMDAWLTPAGRSNPYRALGEDH